MPTRWSLPKPHWRTNKRHLHSYFFAFTKLHVYKRENTKFSVQTPALRFPEQCSFKCPFTLHTPHLSRGNESDGSDGHTVMLPKPYLDNQRTVSAWLFFYQTQVLTKGKIPRFLHRLLVFMTNTRFLCFSRPAPL